MLICVTLYELTMYEFFYIRAMMYTHWLNEHMREWKHIARALLKEAKKCDGYIWFLMKINKKPINICESNKRKIKPNMKLTSPFIAQFHGIQSLVFVLLCFETMITRCKKEQKKKNMLSDTDF